MRQTPRNLVKMRVLYVDQTGELGGGEFSLFSEVTLLPHEATVVLFEDGPFRLMLEEAGITVHILRTTARGRGVRKLNGLWAVMRSVPSVASLVWRLARHARGHDLIYANSQKAFVVGALAAALTGKRLVWRLRDVLDPAQFGKLLCWVAVTLANWRAACVIANSEATGRAFVAAAGHGRLVAVAYPGIDPAPFEAVTAAEIAAARAELAAGDARLVGIFGRLCDWKGQLVFVEAIARVPGVIGVIVGGPLFGEEAFAARLRDRIAELGIGARVRMLGFRRDIPALMKAMDVIVHASTTPEPFGRVVVEAMLAGRPVVASRAGGVMEILRDGETGFLVAPGDAQELAARLADRLAVCDAGAVGRAAAADALGRFTTRGMVKQIEQALLAV
jgi:glycosyltransferase involved in cell wall biosynthesis